VFFGPFSLLYFFKILFDWIESKSVIKCDLGKRRGVSNGRKQTKSNERGRPTRTQFGDYVYQPTIKSRLYSRHFETLESFPRFLFHIFFFFIFLDGGGDPPFFARRLPRSAVTQDWSGYDANGCVQSWQLLPSMSCKWMDIYTYIQSPGWLKVFLLVLVSSDSQSNWRFVLTDTKQPLIFFFLCVPFRCCLPRLASVTNPITSADPEPSPIRNAHVYICWRMGQTHIFTCAFVIT
jgi:hypothetical protein